MEKIQERLDNIIELAMKTPGEESIKIIEEVAGIEKLLREQVRVTQNTLVEMFQSFEGLSDVELREIDPNEVAKGVEEVCQEN